MRDILKKSRRLSSLLPRLGLFKFRKLFFISVLDSFNYFLFYSFILFFLFFPPHLYHIWDEIQPLGNILYNFYSLSLHQKYFSRFPFFLERKEFVWVVFCLSLEMYFNTVNIWGRWTNTFFLCDAIFFFLNPKREVTIFFFAGD